MKILIRGAGDIATGIALRLYRAGMQVVMTDLPAPTAIRRTVCFSQAIILGEMTVEDVTARRAETPDQAEALLAQGLIPVLADPDCTCRTRLRPDALVDAILAKRNLGTKMDDAPIVVGIGPGFTAGEDCHAVVETMRGHDLGRLLTEGGAIPNTGVPGEIGGYTRERIIRAPARGIFEPLARIGQPVTKGTPVARVGGAVACAELTGIVRGMLPAGLTVEEGMKAGDIDPRCQARHCFTVSDKARAIGGGVLEGLLYFERRAGLWSV